MGDSDGDSDDDYAFDGGNESLPDGSFVGGGLFSIEVGSDQIRGNCPTIQVTSSNLPITTTIAYIPVPGEIIDGIPEFETLRVTTMTLVVALSGQINAQEAFHFLPITPVIANRKGNKSCKVPPGQTPGNIFCLRFGPHTRGLVRNSKVAFRNSIGIDIATNTKNVNLKLSHSTIHLCGARSKTDGEEAAQYIIDHCYRIQRLLHRISEERKDFNMISTFDWLMETTKGPIAYREINQPTVAAPGAVSITMVDTPRTVNITMVKPDNEIIVPTNIPEYVDGEVAAFVLNWIPDFHYHSDFCSKIGFTRNAPHQIIIEHPQVQNVAVAMANHNYSLGFEIIPIKLEEALDGYDGFFARYNEKDNSTVIELPYTPVPSLFNKRKPNKVPRHTFIVYKRGSVTQSGPGPELMRPVYYRFMQAIRTLRARFEYIPEILTKL